MNNGFGAIVSAYTKRTDDQPKGTAQVVLVERFLGEGWYRGKVVLMDDPECQERTMYFNVEKGGETNQ